MNRTMITATNTLSQLQKQMDTISHNLANSDTNGYKRREATFSELLVQQFDNQPDPRLELGRLTPNGVRQGVGAKLGQSQMILTQGVLKSTGRELDFALNNNRQFFKVLVEENGQNQVRYTRDGAFYVSPLGNGEAMLVNGQGHPVLDENDQYITFPEDIEGFNLQAGGGFIVNGANGQSQQFDLGIVSIQKPQFLEQYGNNLVGLPVNMDNTAVTEQEILTNLEGAGRNGIQLSQGTLEASNVDMGKEMTELINVQRSYQFQSRSITLADQMMGLVNGIR